MLNGPPHGGIVGPILEWMDALTIMAYAVLAVYSYKVTEDQNLTLTLTPNVFLSRVKAMSALTICPIHQALSNTTGIVVMKTNGISGDNCYFQLADTDPNCEGLMTRLDAVKLQV